MLKHDTIISMKPEIKLNYIISSQHRNKQNNNKSVWIITELEEIELFKKSIIKGWYEDTKSWALVKNGKDFVECGITAAGRTSSVAKFLDSSKNMVWHGYPADIKNNKQDIPPTRILLKWKSEELIKKYQISRIKRGIECNL